MSEGKKLSSSFINMLVVLVLISLISSGVLGLTYEYTKDDIAANQLEKQLSAIRAVLPEYDNADILSDAVEVDGFMVYPGYKDGALVGVAVLGITNKAFSGEMQVMAGFLPDGTLNSSIATKHSETPGLGSKVNEEKFASQFVTLPLESGQVLTVSKDGGIIDAVTAATISSRAYCDAVSLAWAAAETYFGGVQ